MQRSLLVQKNKNAKSPSDWFISVTESEGDYWVLLNDYGTSAHGHQSLILAHERYAVKNSASLFRGSVTGSTPRQRRFGDDCRTTRVVPAC